jgi:catechol-2,3-dioxygenase
MSSINARLRRVHLQSPQPRELAAFYGRAYGLQVSQQGGTFLCQGNERQVAVSAGTAGQLHYALFSFASPHDWQAFEQRTSKLPRAAASRFPELPAGAVCFQDPEGNHIAFCQDTQVGTAPASGRLAGFTQHYALRTTKMAEMVRFYHEAIGFELSDNVRDELGDLRACFLRSDALHHCLALFKSPVACFDHQAFESPSWEHVKQWADHMSAERIEITWGVGRHGPGNDTFFMIRDLDQNLVEISAELEVCAPTRPVGEWKHEERTLNLWGKAILRS